MKITTSLLLVVAAVFATGAMAGTPLSGMQVCKPVQPRPVAIADKPNHAFAIITTKCSWTKPFEILGIATKDGTDYVSSEMSGDNAADHGYYVSAMANGDKYVVRFTGTSRSQEGRPVSSQGTWSFADGQGKLMGIRGGGTYKGTAGADGSMSYEVKGEYTLP
jgi:hypothetical protein